MNPFVRAVLFIIGITSAFIGIDQLERHHSHDVCMSQKNIMNFYKMAYMQGVNSGLSYTIYHDDYLQSFKMDSITTLYTIIIENK